MSKAYIIRNDEAVAVIPDTKLRKGNEVHFGYDDDMTKFYQGFITREKKYESEILIEAYEAKPKLFLLKK